MNTDGRRIAIIIQFIFNRTIYSTPTCTLIDPIGPSLDVSSPSYEFQYALHMRSGECAANSNMLLQLQNLEVRCCIIPKRALS